MKALSLQLSFLVLALFATLAQAGDDTLRVRIAAANISSGPNQTYDPGHGARMFQAAKPDIVAIQEFNYGDNSSDSIRKFVDENFGKDFVFHREQTKGLHIPNGIISRYPIVDSGSWTSPVVSDRGYAWAKLKLPSGEHMYVVSVHLHTKSPGNRNLEAETLVRKIKENFPENAMVVVAGDLNTKNDNEKAFKTLDEVAGESHKPKGGDGKTTTNAPRNKRYDVVLVSKTLDKYHTAVELESEKYPDGLVFDTRTLPSLPKPAKKDDSAAENMQHMMVIKDFAIPSPKPHVEEKKDGDSPSTH